jgi:hypothetical protein
MYSSGGVALHLFLKLGGDKSIFHLKREIFLNLKKTYYGGRCEVFGNPMYLNGKIRHFDFEGMYHSCLLDNFPDNNLFFSNQSIINQPGFYFIKMKYFCNIPILPIKTDKLYFPEGEIEGLY